jgi:hypothetical protein
MEGRLAIGDGKKDGTRETEIKMIGGKGIRVTSSTEKSFLIIQRKIKNE